MKVIKRGHLPTKQVTCHNCKSVLEYNGLDMELVTGNYDIFLAITCPVCKCRVRVEGFETMEDDKP